MDFLPNPLFMYTKLAFFRKANGSGVLARLNIHTSPRSRYNQKSMTLIQSCQKHESQREGYYKRKYELTVTARPWSTGWHGTKGKVFSEPPQVMKISADV